MRILFSYRRADSAAWTGRLRDALAARFGEEGIFQDVVAVRPGETFTDAIDSALAECDLTLAVIGPNWLAEAGAGGESRLADSDDYVRRELAAALGTGRRVVPVLVGGAALPTATQLPTDVQPLATRQAIACTTRTGTATSTASSGPSTPDRRPGVAGGNS